MWPKAIIEAIDCFAVSKSASDLVIDNLHFFKIVLITGDLDLYQSIWFYRALVITKNCYQE